MGYYVKVSNRFSESFPTVIFRMWFLFCNKMIKSDIYYFYEGTWEGCKNMPNLERETHRNHYQANIGFSFKFLTPFIMYLYHNQLNFIYLPFLHPT